MTDYSKVTEKFRELFGIATDVKDNEINRAIQEADKLDIKSNLCGYVYATTPVELGGGKASTGPGNPVTDDDYSIVVDIKGVAYDIVPLYTILCYYAFARYLKNDDQKSTSTGIKIQQYGNSIIVPDTSKNKRYEEERGKADAFIGDFHKVLDLYTNQSKDDSCSCDKTLNYRCCFIS